MKKYRIRKIINKHSSIHQGTYSSAFIKEVVTKIYMWEDDFFGYHCSVTNVMESI